MLKMLAKKALRAAGLAVTRLNDSDDRLLELRLARVREAGAPKVGVIVEKVIDGRTVRFFVTRDTDYIQRFHRTGRFYEEEVLERLGEHFRGGVFVDVGANVGNHALYAALFLGASRVIAIEPVPETATNLAVNVAINDLSDRVRIERVGLSNTPGKATFSTPPGNIGATRLAADPLAGTLRLVRGDDLLGEQRVDFIKIDVEGMEIEVLEGLRRAIARDRPRLFVEVESERNGARFFEFLESAGYEVAGSPIIEGRCANYFAVPAASG